MDDVLPCKQVNPVRFRTGALGRDDGLKDGIPSYYRMPRVEAHPKGRRLPVGSGESPDLRGLSDNG